MDGAGWERKTCRLVEPLPKMLYTPLPVVHMSAYSRAVGNTPQQPTHASQVVSIYSCPVYKKPSRTDLNFIFPLSLKSVKDTNYWTMRGVALLCDVK